MELFEDVSYQSCWVSSIHLLIPVNIEGILLFPIVIANTSTLNLALLVYTHLERRVPKVIPSQTIESSLLIIPTTHNLELVLHNKP